MERLAAEPELDLLVYGHSHVAALERMASGGVYANAGSWLFDATYLVITPEEVSLRRWDAALAEGHRLHGVDRRAEELLADT